MLRNGRGDNSSCISRGGGGGAEASEFVPPSVLSRVEGTCWPGRANELAAAKPAGRRRARDCLIIAAAAFAAPAPNSIQGARRAHLERASERENVRALIYQLGSLNSRRHCCHCRRRRRRWRIN